MLEKKIPGEYRETAHAFSCQLITSVLEGYTYLLERSVSPNVEVFVALMDTGVSLLFSFLSGLKYVAISQTRHGMYAASLSGTKPALFSA